MTISVVVTPAHVREIISNTLADDEIAGLISASLTLIKSRTLEQNIDPDVQVEMIRWTAAHFVAVRGSQSSVSPGTATVVEEKVGDSSVKYSDPGPATISPEHMLNLKSTFWGQTAIALDPTGTLGSLGGKPPRLVSL